MLTLYAIPESLYAAKIRILMRQKGLEWCELPPPGGYGSDEYKRVVPSGNIPAMIDGDLLLADSEAIAEYVEERFPNPPMLPEDLSGRAKARERSRFHDTRLEPAVRALFGHIDPSARDPLIVDRQSASINARLAQFARMLCDRRDDLLTLGDCGFPVSFAWIDVLSPVLPLTVDWPQEIIDYRLTLQGHESVAAEMGTYRPKIEHWVASKQ